MYSRIYEQYYISVNIIVRIRGWRSASTTETIYTHIFDKIESEIKKT